MLECERIHFGYRPDRPVLSDVSARFLAGEVTAMVGPNGAGKSTLLRVLAGVESPTSGSVLLDGEALASLSLRRRASRLALMPQHSSVAFPFRVREVVGFGVFADGSTSRNARVDGALEAVELLDKADEVVQTLSAGQRQRVTLARALAQIDATASHGRPRVLLADEPVSAMDPAHALRAMELLSRLARSGLAVGVVLHDLSLALRFGDTVVALDAGGRLAAEGKAEEVLSPASLRGLYGVDFRVIVEPGGAGAILPWSAADTLRSAP